MDGLVAEPDAPLGWKRDLAVFHMAYGDDLRAAGRTELARKQWSLALQTVETQLEKRNDDPRLQTDRAVLRSRLSLPSAPSSVSPALPAACRVS